MSSQAWLLAPILVGLSQPVLWQMNVRVSDRSGEMEAAVVLHVVGAVAGAAIALAGLRGAGGWVGLADAPPWAFLAGVLGVCGMAAMIKAIPAVGIAAVLALTVAAQMIAALVFESQGWLGTELRALDWTRLVGAGLLAVGAWLVTR